LPFTPFHFGPGLALKGAAAPVFSWSAFAAAQVLIDCETLYYLVRQEYPVHRFFHSFLGATAAALVAAILCPVIVRVSTVRFPWLIAPSTSAARGEFSSLRILVGGFIGGVSHPFLDGIMHPDVRPFMPWSDNNPLSRSQTSFAGAPDHSLTAIWCQGVGRVGAPGGRGERWRQEDRLAAKGKRTGAAS
jgi:membrane-bound metal-dependent hydrolase YbcI (DUF457 family)